jgi:hypothetical protein
MFDSIYFDIIGRCNALRPGGGLRRPGRSATERAHVRQVVPRGITSGPSERALHPAKVRAWLSDARGRERGLLRDHPRLSARNKRGHILERPSLCDPMAFPAGGDQHKRSKASERLTGYFSRARAPSFGA